MRMVSGSALLTAVTLVMTTTLGSSIRECQCASYAANSVCVRSVFHHKTNTVILVELPKYILAVKPRRKEKPVILCPNGKAGVLKGLEINRWTHKAIPYLTHSFARILCPDGGMGSGDPSGKVTVRLQEPHSRRGSRCEITLATYVSRRATAMDSDGDGVVATPNYHVCAMTAVLFGQPHYLDEWLQHQLDIGVEHIVAYAVTNQGDDARITPLEPSPMFNALVDSGKMTVVPWEMLLGPDRIFYRSQHLAYSDYVYRFRGMCEWTAFADTDDFWVNFQNNHNLSEFIAQHEEEYPSVDMMLFCWHLFYPDCGRKPDVPLLDSLLFGKEEPRNFKHVTRTRALTEVGIHGSSTTGRPVCGGVEMWHIRSGYPGPTGWPGAHDLGNCDVYRLPDDFYRNLRSNWSYSLDTVP